MNAGTRVCGGQRTALAWFFMILETGFLTGLVFTGGDKAGCWVNIRDQPASASPGVELTNIHIHT